MDIRRLCHLSASTSNQQANPDLQLPPQPMFMHHELAIVTTVISTALNNYHIRSFSKVLVERTTMGLGQEACDEDWLKQQQQHQIRHLVHAPLLDTFGMIQ